jgi:hypothetical protein
LCDEQLGSSVGQDSEKHRLDIGCVMSSWAGYVAEVTTRKYGPGMLDSEHSRLVEGEVAGYSLLSFLNTFASQGDPL